MQAAPPLQPTLWRTCRAIANRNRLQIFEFLVQQPGQTVCAIARHLRLPMSLSSEYLRGLEARGLLTARRRGRSVKYRPTSANDRSSFSGLAAAMGAIFKNDPQPIETIFRIATNHTSAQD